MNTARFAIDALCHEGYHHHHSKQNLFVHATFDDKTITVIYLDARKLVQNFTSIFIFDYQNFVINIFILFQVLVLDADLDLSQITEEYKKSEHRILRQAVDVVMNSPNKHSPKKPITGSPISIVPKIRL